MIRVLVVDAREIAKTLHITEGTVRNYISRILGELELGDRTQAALWAYENLDRHSI